MSDVYFSNGHFSNQHVKESVNWLLMAGCKNIELSCGRVEREDLKFLKALKAKGNNIRLHNYFPSLEKNFVMNLASKDAEIIQSTMDIITSALRWSHELESNYYAFHFGFLFDPKPSELGGKLIRQEMCKYDEAKKRFKDRLYLLKEYADPLGVQIAVENNVYDARNYLKFKEHVPLLGVAEDLIEDLLIEGVGLLLDFGHLKVSATTLGKDFHQIYERWLPHISGFHLSDNNGLEDQNDAFEDNAWFMNYIKETKMPLTIEVYTQNADLLKTQGTLVEENLH